MSWVVALIFLGVLFVVVMLPLYSALKLHQITSGGLSVKPLAMASIIALAYVLVLAGARVYSADAARWVVYGLGVINFAFVLSLGYWLALLLCRIFGSFDTFARPIVFRSYLLLVMLMSSFAVWQYERPVTVEERILYSDKLSSPVRLLHISDVQYGSLTRKEMDEHFELAYSLQPDVIVFTGDLIDFDDYQLEDFDILARSPVPIFFARGNHEFYHDAERLLTYLETLAPVRLLLNDREVFGGVELVGVDYSQQDNYLAQQLIQIPRDSDLFSVLLYHEPKDIEVAAAANFDLQLYGHLHGGQIWPFTWIVDWMYEYSDGFYQLGETTAYISDGVGLWGPRMRLGSENDMVMFYLTPK